MAEDKVFLDLEAIRPSESTIRARIIDMLAPNQGPVGELVRWGRQLTIRTGPRVLDLDAATCTPVHVPELDVVHLVAGDTVRFAGGLRGGVATLLRDRGAGWEQVALPPEVPPVRDTRMTLYARGEALAVVFAGYQAGLAWWNGACWRSAPLDRRPQHVLVSETRVLLGFAAGEWGGGVWSMSESGVADVSPGDGLPVMMLAPLPDGAALVGTGLAHMGVRRANLWALQPDASWKVVSRFGPWVMGPRGEVAAARSRHEDVGEPAWTWTLPPDMPWAVDFDGRRRLHLLMSRHGVVRVDDGVLRPLTPLWPAGAQLGGVGLALEGDLAVIATSSSGVLLWKLGTSDVRHIAIPATRR